ncbi:nicotinate-nucleotide--dimethylbenzimidazole phosphoribosyltransferase [Peterkaempfera sp. SMS 1(5)a]|uniref:nicotinate-nucleotide--dimethylbenzimidazole phosphoribosyltransferase n=1 Tax=Peterkaempfera podocarpi TaxID=3232308 RepID=UPI00366E97B3
MTDTGHVPGEGLPERPLAEAGPDPAYQPVGAPAEAAGAGFRPDPFGPGPETVPGAAPAMHSSFTFLDEPDQLGGPDQLDEEEDVLLMPGPQGSWSEAALREQTPPEGTPLPVQPHLGGSPAETMPLRTVTVEDAAAYVGTPIAPSWPPLAPPDAAVLAAAEAGAALQAAPAEPGVPQAEQAAVPEAPADPFTVPAPAAPAAAPVQAPAQQPSPSAASAAAAAAAAPRRPLHAGPPIPDPSLMTGQVPVRSLADRGPSSGETQGYGIRLVPPQSVGGADVAAVAPAPQPAVPAAASAAVPAEQAQAAQAPAVAEVAAPAEAAPVPVPAQAPAGTAAVEQPSPSAIAVETVSQAPEVPHPAPLAAVPSPGGSPENAPERGRPEPLIPSPSPSPDGPPSRIAAFLAVPPAPGLSETPVAEAGVPTSAAETAQPTAPEAGPVPQALADDAVSEAVAAPVAVTPVVEPVVEPVEQVAVPQAEAPEPAVTPAPAAAPSSQDDAAGLAAPVPANPVPADPVAPESTPVPEAVLPESAVPEAVVPEAVVPEAVVSESAAPESAAPESASLWTAGPEGVVAEAAVPVPEAPAVEQPADLAAVPVEPQQPEASDSAPAAEAAPAAVEAIAVEPVPAAAPAEEESPRPTVHAVAADGTVTTLDAEPTEAPVAVEPPAPADAVAPEVPMAPEAPVAPEAPTAPEAQPEPEAVAPSQPQPEAAQPEAPLPEREDLLPEPEEPQGPAAAGYEESMREAVHRVMRERRDIRNGFRRDPIPHDVLIRVLEAAHTAPSVGYSQPWDFVVIRSAKTRKRMHQLAERQRDAYAASLPKGRAKQFKALKIEAILETPVNIVVTADRTRGGRHTLGRHTQPQMAPYSAALAVENLWLAARAEGLGVGWVSFFDEREMVRELGLPEHLDVVAYLCVGYVDSFPDEPELQQAGWAKKRPLSWVVHEEQYGNRALPGEEPHSVLEDTLRGIRPLDAKALGEAWDRQKRMTKPAGSLGMLEIISAQLCGLSRKCPPPIPEPACVAIFAGDHGVHAQGVTPWPQEVTAQMVGNFLAGGAVVNAFAAQVGAEVCVVDVGVAAELPAPVQEGRTTGLLPRKVRPGTADMTQGPAMSREEALRALEIGVETARDLVAAGNKVIITGDMGIANTTPAAALISVFTGADPAEVTGRGTGIDDETHARKVEVIRRALELHKPDPGDPVGVLAAVGGLEHAAIAGLLLGAASLRTPVILDGVIAGAAALAAKAIAPEVLAACIAGHRSAEPGHKTALAKLGLRPLVDLDLRLGEGTGALLALPVVQSAARAMHDVATFDSAGVTEKR